MLFQGFMSFQALQKQFLGIFGDLRIAEAPKAMFVKEYGSFMKLDELFGGRPVYYNEVFKMRLGCEASLA